jgi:hypothetical protein
MCSSQSVTIPGTKDNLGPVAISIIGGRAHLPAYGPGATAPLILRDQGAR